MTQNESIITKGLWLIFCWSTDHCSYNWMTRKLFFFFLKEVQIAGMMFSIWSAVNCIMFMFVNAKCAKSPAGRSFGNTSCKLETGKYQVWQHVKLLSVSVYATNASVIYVIHAKYSPNTSIHTGVFIYLNRALVIMALQSNTSSREGEMFDCEDSDWWH